MGFSFVKINNKISILPDGDSSFASLTEKSNKYKDKITNTFINTQNLIFKNFFDYEFNNINNLEDTDNFRRKLDKFKTLIGTTNNYSFFDDYYLEMMNKLEHKCNILENGGETAISTNNKFLSLFQKLKNLFFKKETDKI